LRKAMLIVPIVGVLGAITQRPVRRVRAARAIAPALD
jgi:hypothetical protein